MGLAGWTEWRKEGGGRLLPTAQALRHRTLDMDELDELEEVRVDSKDVKDGTRLRIETREVKGWERVD